MNLLSESKLLLVHEVRSFHEIMVIFEPRSYSLYLFDISTEKPAKLAKIIKLRREDGELLKEEDLDCSTLKRFSEYCGYPSIGLIDLPGSKHQTLGYVAELDDTEEEGSNFYLFRLWDAYLKPWMAMRISGAGPGER